MLFPLKQDLVHLLANDCDGLQGKEKNTSHHSLSQ